LTAAPVTPGLAGWIHLVVFGLLIPIGAWLTRRRLLHDELPPKKAFYAGVIVQQVLLLALSLVVARALGLDLFPAPGLEVREIAVGLGILAATVPGAAVGWRRQVRRGDRFALLVAPRDGVDHGLWAVISVLAGVGEEVAYRGVLFLVLTGLTGSPVAAALVASAAFGAAHLAQGVSGAALVALAAAGFHLLTWWSGALYLAIAVHVAWDLIAGIGHWAAARSVTGSPARTPS
jgi:membrane protease YdiL (CAAX protease family)